VSSVLLLPCGGAVVLAMSAIFFVTLGLAEVRTLIAG
jgi:hypothetical protein